MYNKQQVLERTNLPTFLTLFKNAVINMNHLVRKLLMETHRQKESYIIVY
jgi:hypothetical protein